MLGTTVSSDDRQVLARTTATDRRNQVCSPGRAFLCGQRSARSEEEWGVHIRHQPNASPSDQSRHENSSAELPRLPQHTTRQREKEKGKERERGKSKERGREREREYIFRVYSRHSGIFRRLKIDISSLIRRTGYSGCCSRSFRSS